MKRHLQCAEQQASPFNLTKCCACYEKWLASLILVTYETSFTLRGATGITLQPNIAPGTEKNLIFDPRHIWNVIYNARSNRSHPPISPSAAPATQNDSHHLSSWHMKRYLQCAEEQASPANLTKYCAFTMRGATSITLQPHQILRLPLKMILMIDIRGIWNAIYNARSNRHHPPTSPNTAPATQKCTPKSKRNSPRTVEASIPMRGRFDHDPNMIRPWTRHLAPARSPRLLRAPAIYPDFTEDCACHKKWHSNLTKYCACHKKWFSWSISVTYETSFTMRGATSITLQPHQILRLPLKMILMIDIRDIWNIIYNARSNKHHLQPYQILRRPRKMTLMIDLRRIWNVIYNARSNRHHPPTLPNTAPATKNDSHDWYPWHMKRHLQCAEQQASPSNLTKYCACHGKRISSLILVTYETSFTMRGATSITLQPHQILRLPLKMILMIDIRDIWNVIYNARSNKHHPPTSPNTAPATEKESHLWSSSYMKRHLQCAEQQASPSNLTKYCACH